MSLLYIKASPRQARSRSIAVANAFCTSYCALHPQEECTELDVFKAALPTLDGHALDTKYAILHGNSPSAVEKNAWKPVENIIAQFKSAEKYVFAVPMWNFGIPYRLKQYFDIIIQPTYTFSYIPQKGYTGLVTGKRAFIVYASGGEYAKGSQAEEFDLQKKYLELLLGFMGITDILKVAVEPTLMAGPDVAEQAQIEAIGLARDLAKTF